MLTTIGIAGAIGLCAWGVRAVVITYASPPGWTPAEGPNSPIGVARGIHPGRVVWMHDPAATSWDGTSNYYYSDQFTSLSESESMISGVIQKLTDQSSDAAAWDALFKYYNQIHARGRNGYTNGENITIKINCNNSPADGASPSNKIDATPQMVKALVRQLVNAAGVSQTNIIVYDAQRDVGRVRSYCTNEFPAVQFLGFNGTNFLRSAVITFATNAVAANSGSLPGYVTNATYSINLALLKRHCEVVDLFDWRDINGQAEISCCFKNHFGSSSNPSGMHTMIRDWRNGMGSYNALVDLEGSRYLEGKTMLYLIDGLYGGKRYDAIPVRWNMPPFNNNWPASLFASQDIVAIDSVALDFLRSEWGLMPNADNFLHEAALANNPPSGIVYAPNGDGVRLGSLGVHEHWNNALSKQYSRNLSTNGTGIELVTIHPGSGINVALTSPINGAAINPLTSVTLQAAAVSAYTGIRQIDYYGNGMLLGTSNNRPYPVVWSNAPAGTWALTAVATDAENLSATSAVVNVTVISNNLAVAITSPTNAALLFEGSNLVQAAESAGSSTIRNVDFYANGAFIGASSNSSDSAVLANLFPGTWTFTAIATDTNSFSILSDPVTVTVQPAKIAIAGSLYVDLRATNLSADGGVWTNWGTLGNFVKYGSLTHVINVANTGIPGVDLQYGSANSFAGPNSIPALEGSSARSVEVWAFNGDLNKYWPTTNGSMVAWSHRGGQPGTAFAVNDGPDLQSGAALQGDATYNIGWGTSNNIPPPNMWHHFVYTYDGGTICRIYVDGTLRIVKNLPGPLNTAGGSPILIGGSSSVPGGMADGSTRSFGCINSIRIHGGELSPEDVAKNFTAGPAVADLPSLIQNATIANGKLNFTFTTIPGRSYYLESTDSLNPPSWTSLTPAQTAMGTSMTISNLTAAHLQQFYRITLAP